LNILTPAVNCWGEFHFVPYSRVTEVVVMVVGPTEDLQLDTLVSNNGCILGTHIHTKL